MQQLSLSFPFLEESSNFEDFIISDSNKLAVSFIKSWPDWLSQFGLIYGETGSGKTEITNLWKNYSCATKLTNEDLKYKSTKEILNISQHFIIDDIEKITSEESLFHIINTLKGSNRNLLITSTKKPSELIFLTKDLYSRINSVVSIKIDNPNCLMLKALFLKLFIKKQISIRPEVIDYIIIRMERSFKEVHRIVNFLDHLSLLEQKKITIPFIKKNFFYK